eukprot:Gb_34661 [translate_table: standard]
MKSLMASMASLGVNGSSLLGKRKQRDRIVSEDSADWFIPFGELEELPDLPHIVTALPSNLKAIDHIDGGIKSVDNKICDSVLQMEDEECCHTPKSEEYKIPNIICCPPAPRKPTSPTLTNREPQLSPQLGIFIPSDLDLDLLFDSNPNTYIRQHTEKKKTLRKNKPRIEMK